MSAADVLLPVAIAIGQLGLDAAAGRLGKSDAARRLIGLGLQLVPREELLAYLSPAGAATAEFVADVAEAERFPGG